MKATFKIIVGLLITSMANASSIPIYDFNSDDIRRSHKVRKALGTNRFSVNRMNQFANSAHFAAISHECVALVQAKYDRFKPRPPITCGDRGYGGKRCRPPVPGEIDGRPQPAPTPFQDDNAIESNQKYHSRGMGAINPDLYYERYSYQKPRIYVTQVSCHNNRKLRPMSIVRPLPIGKPVYGEEIETFHNNDRAISSDSN